MSLTPNNYHAIIYNQRYNRESDGYFDIAVGSITKELYGFGESERVAKESELERAKVDFNGLHFEKRKAWLDEGTIIDLGGMGKGFAVDKVAEFLREQKITEGEIALSGDIRCLALCEMGIQNPFGEGTAAAFSTRAANTAISTSGNYRRYIEKKTDNHLIDPKRKRPEQLFASVTLISHGFNSDIDAYATAASVMPLAKAIAFLEKRGVGYILITNGGERYVSKNMGTFTADFRFTE
jgi:thiamine biosynthesis lipoprotein